MMEPLLSARLRANELLAGCKACNCESSKKSRQRSMRKSDRSMRTSDRSMRKRATRSFRNLTLSTALQGVRASLQTRQADEIASGRRSKDDEYGPTRSLGHCVAAWP
jgi:sugar diacid utilization regulator